LGFQTVFSILMTCNTRQYHVASRHKILPVIPPPPPPPHMKSGQMHREPQETCDDVNPLSYSRPPSRPSSPCQKQNLCDNLTQYVFNG